MRTFILSALICAVSAAVEIHIYPITSYRVIDGDTVEVVIDMGFDISKETDARISGINTPENRGDEKAAGLLVTAEVIEWLSDKTLYYQYQGVGKYGGRSIGDIVLEDGTKLSTYLLESGYAKEYDGRSKMPRFSEDELNKIIASINSDE